MQRGRRVADTLQVPSALTSRSHSRSSMEEAQELLPGGVESLATQDGPLSLEATELLGHILIDPPHNEEGSRSSSKSGQLTIRGWSLFKKPSPWFIFPYASIGAGIWFATVAPLNEIYVKLACAQLRPDTYGSPIPPSFPSINHTTPIGPLFLSERLTPAHSLLSSAHVLLKRSDSALPAINLPAENTRCTSDPVVLEAVARLTTVMTVILGIGMILTAGWWAKLSDRYGRKAIMGLSVFGVVFMETCVILVTHFRERLPGGYWFLLVASVVDGILGGTSTGSAVSHAYISDCTQPHERVRLFAIFLGMIFCGMSVGPTIGSLLIHWTNDLLTPFYVALSIHVSGMLYYWFILPESLTPDVMRASRDKHELERESNHAFSLSILAVFRFILKLLEPLAVFLPRKKERGRGRDWNLTLFGISYAIMLTYISLATYKIQYAIAVFNWSAEDLGYWLSVVGVARALHLLVVLPLITKWLKPKDRGIALRSPMPPPPRDLSDSEVDEEARLTSNSSTEPEVEPGRMFPTPNTTSTPELSARFDHNIARASLMVEFVSFSIIAASTNPGVWIFGSVLGSFGAGFGPSMQSLSLFLSDGIENGKLFGSIAVVSAIGSSLIGPAIFGGIYVNTVATFPKAIFIVPIIGSFVAFACMSFIRLPQSPLQTVVTDEEEVFPDED